MLALVLIALSAGAGGMEVVHVLVPSGLAARPEKSECTDRGRGNSGAGVDRWVNLNFWREGGEETSARLDVPDASHLRPLLAYAAAWAKASS